MRIKRKNWEREGEGDVCVFQKRHRQIDGLPGVYIQPDIQHKEAQ